MTTVEKELIMDLCLNKISMDSFIQEYPFDLTVDKSYFVNVLNDTLVTKNKDDVEYALLISGRINNIKIYYPVVRKLILEDWHNQHEHLVDILSGSNDPDDAKYFYHVLKSEYSYIDDIEDFLVPIWIKCIWALGRINTPDSKRYLQEFKESPYEEVKAATLIQLKNKS